MKKILLTLFTVALMANPLMAHADEVTHTIGTTGYMIQEAMWAKANRLDADNYYQAVKLQYEAKRYLRGTHKKGRNISKAMELTKQAYELAKTARDSALKQQNLRVSY